MIIISEFVYPTDRTESTDRDIYLHLMLYPSHILMHLPQYFPFWKVSHDRAERSTLSFNRRWSVETDHNSTLSPSSTVGGGIDLVSLGCLFEAITIGISPTSNQGVMIAARVPSNLYSAFSYLLTYKIQFDITASHLHSLPLRPEDWTNQARLENQVRILISRDTNIM